MSMKNHPGILLLAALVIFAAPGASRADSLFRLFPEAEMSGYYSDNVPLRTHNGEGDFAGTLVAGFYLDYTSEARYASLHWDTFAQIFAHQSRFDRAGQGQFVSATDNENINPTTKLHIDEFFYRDAPTSVAVTTSNQVGYFNSTMVGFLLAGDRESVNHFIATLTHDWGHRWFTLMSVRQETLWGPNGNTSFAQGFSLLAMYHYNDRLDFGPGYKFYDFRFTVPGRPGSEAHWPFLDVNWIPIENLYLSGQVGPVVTYTFGTNRQTIDVGGIASVRYVFRRGHADVYGGQEPDMTAGLSGAGTLDYVRGTVAYELSRRLTANAGAGYNELKGTGINAQLIVYGVGLNERVNRWLNVFVRYTGVRRTVTAPSQFLPGETTSGQEAVGNYYVIGFSVWTEAFRWSWQ